MWVSQNILKSTIYFVGSGGQLSRVFDLRPLCYLEHCWLIVTLESVDNHLEIKSLNSIAQSS